VMKMLNSKCCCFYSILFTFLPSVHDSRPMKHKYSLSSANARRVRAGFVANCIAVDDLPFVRPLTNCCHSDRQSWI